jgi:SAM-dependent methyltransferase
LLGKTVQFKKADGCDLLTHSQCRVDVLKGNLFCDGKFAGGGAYVCAMDALREALGQTDIHLVDLMMKGKLAGVRAVLDVGAGRGRNLQLFSGLRCVALDPDADRLAECPEGVERIVGRVEEQDWAPAFDLVICCAVLHFATDEAAFESMLRACWAAVAPGGILFVRTASDLAGRDFTVGDGVAPFFLSAEDCADWTNRLGAAWEEPLRTSVVAGGRSMATWVLRKPAADNPSLKVVPERPQK